MITDTLHLQRIQHRIFIDVSFFRTSEDLTPLHIAASWGCFQNLRLLLRNGGDPNIKDQVRHLDLIPLEDV